MKKIKQKLEYFVLWCFVKYIIISQMGADTINKKLKDLKTRRT